ncbi:hypothetical protein CHS0354_018840 [Potamilus streckersoni]|uniref:EGF-like domain-containing protein n=1 Tax=Potamilus streckersoni TaxID=2493646 RepID=A0AAE0VVV5_9BIVA|nr:hypothetical protein CHS0354_018840 [Potamilus streckersoni]
MDWADSHLENAKTNCISLVDLNQPIPKEALKQFSSLSNSSSLNNTSSGSDNYSTTTPTTDNSTDVSNIFNAELLEELEALSCPLDCNGRGLCRNGTCSCQKGYGDVDCSVDLSQPPITFGIPDRGICDLQKRPCRKTSVLGQHFIESKSLMCRTIHYQILQNGTKLVRDNQTQLAELISDSEVECILPQGRDRRKADSLNDCIEIEKPVKHEESNLWIIGAVLGPVGLLVLLGAIIVIVRKRTRTKKVPVSVEMTRKLDNHHKK